MRTRHFSKKLLVLGAGLWFSPLQFRQSCWNADIILRLRQTGRAGFWMSGWLVFKAMFLPLRLQCAAVEALLDRAGTNAAPQARDDLLEKREVLIRASDLLQADGRKEATGNARDVQEACLRELYRQLLRRNISEESVRPMTRYYYATDAMRDLFDYCHAVGRLHSTTAVAATVPHFIGRLGEHIAVTRNEENPTGRLPAAGSFTAEAARRGSGPVNAILSYYWSEDHARRLRLSADLADLLEEECEKARQQLGSWSVRAMLCHELAMQGLLELSDAHQSLSGPGDTQQFLRSTRRILHAAERLSYTWTLPD